MDVLQAAGIPFSVEQHAAARTAADAQQMLGLASERTVKALVFEDPRGRLFIAAFPGHRRLHYGLLARTVDVARSKLRPAPPEALLRLGMEPGGVSPVCWDAATTIVFDASVPGMGAVYCGSGQAARTLLVDADDIVRLAVRSLVATIVAED
jgi:Cys-tRNA(Pro)/Cys-tRNA(Cys) deacylase